VLTLRPTIFDGYIVALNIADFLQSFSERRREVRTRLRRPLVEKSDHGHRRLLRARGERPRGGGSAAEQRDESATCYSVHPRASADPGALACGSGSGFDSASLPSITWSGRASRLSGTVRPSAFAVLRLMASSNLVGACTGRSAGFSPLRMRST